MQNDLLHAAVQRVVPVRPDICSSAFEVFMFCLWCSASAPGVCIRIRMAGMFGSGGVVPFGADNVPAGFCGLA